ncbi:kinetochore protein SLK19-like [Solanum lycopersicum]|uniref:kinetochore protein SLK19-like n=1 Tax=Solanum lycopersicum TaxID=4081 RepID=UPI0037487720
MVVQDVDNIFNEMFSFMAKSDDEDDENKVTILDFKQNLNTYSLKRLRKLANVLIDGVIELTSERDSMNVEFESLNENRDKMGEKMSLIKYKMTVQKSEKLELKKQLHHMTEKSEKQKGKSTSLQVELEEKLKTTETNLVLGLEKSNSLEKDIAKLKDEHENSLKWIKSSKLLSNETNQKSAHVVFDEDGNLKRKESKVEYELNELFQAQQSERSKVDTGDLLKIDNADQSSFEKTNEADKPKEEPDPIQKSIKISRTLHKMRILSLKRTLISYIR